MKHDAGLSFQQKSGSLGPGFVRAQNAIGAALGESPMGERAKPSEIGRRRALVRPHRFSELEGALKRHLSAIDAMLGSFALPRRSAFHQMAIPADRPPQSASGEAGSEHLSRSEGGDRPDLEMREAPALLSAREAGLAADGIPRRKVHWRDGRAGVAAAPRPNRSNWLLARPRLILTPARMGQFGLLAFLASGMAVLMLQSPEPPKSPALALREAKASAIKAESVEVRTVGAVSVAAPVEAVKPSPVRPPVSAEASQNAALAAPAPAPERPLAPPMVMASPVQPLPRAAPAPTRESAAAASNSLPNAATSRTRIQAAVNMRSKPDNDAPTLTIIPAGASVEFFGCNFWCEVGFEGKRGFVYRSFVGDPVRAENLPGQAKPTGVGAAR